MQAKAQAKLQQIVNFSQEGPHLGNQYVEDVALQTYLPLFLRRGTTVEQRIRMENDLIRFGAKCGSREYLDMNANAEDNKTVLEQFDAWGKRVDRLHTSEGWRYFKREAAIEELSSLPYRQDEKSREYNPNARLHQIVKLMLFQPSGGMVSCPLAMTDGAAFTLNALKSDPATKDYWHKDLDEALDRLTSKDPSRHWTSG